MPRGNEPQSRHQLVRMLGIGDGKCGKSDWAARPIESGYNVLYMDADVGIQTIQGLTRDPKNPVKPSAMQNIFTLPCHDTLVNGGMDFRFVNLFKRFTTQATFRWNDTQSREWSVMLDGDETEDTVWEIRPAMLDHNCVLVLDSWTSLSQSCMNWASSELNIDLMEVSEEERRQMRAVYQAAGEKLTQFLIMIRSLPCHVIVIAHPREFVKTEKKAGGSVSQAEKDMKVLWTKMMPASSSNNHAFMMAKYFTDLGWFEVDSMGDFMVDFRADGSRLSGSHFNKRLNTRSEGRFVDLVNHIGGTVPTEAHTPFDHWLTIHQGFKAPDGKKPGLVLWAQKSADGAPAQVTGIAPATKAQPIRLNLGPK